MVIHTGDLLPHSGVLLLHYSSTSEGARSCMYLPSLNKLSELFTRGGGGLLEKILFVQIAPSKLWTPPV